jgi:organic hydroperoxide reductase OsmC/OhrA
MSEYSVRTTWKKTSADFSYDTYNRSHELVFGSGTTLKASSAPDYKGDADLVNPEEQFIGALSSCHMLTFLAIAAKRGVTVASYTDAASCWLTKDEAGVLSVTRA